MATVRVCGSGVALLNWFHFTRPMITPFYNQNESLFGPRGNLLLDYCWREVGLKRSADLPRPQNPHSKNHGGLWLESALESIKTIPEKGPNQRWCHRFLSVF